MNDETSGQLMGAGCALPEYAQTALWLCSEAESVRVEGPVGLFELSAPAPLLWLRWGHPDGPVLAALHWEPDSLGWDGQVRLGGSVEALHLSAQITTEMAIGVLHLLGGPLVPDARPYPDAALRHDPAAYNAPSYLESLDDTPTGAEASLTTWLVADDDPLLTLAQDAMMNNQRVWFCGTLALDDTPWPGLMALPLLLESVTV